MVEARAKREMKRQLGQFMTPPELAQKVISRSNIAWSSQGRYLEPSFGEGAFLVAAVEELLKFYGNRNQETINHIFEKQIFGVEYDSNLYHKTISMLKNRYGDLGKHNLINSDFFNVHYLTSTFDLIIGNPPFGGTFDPAIEDSLDRRFGIWNGYKLKKETYSFFIAASLDLLQEDGRLIFLSSDTFLTIKTMSGLRHRLLDQANIQIDHLDYFSSETNQTVLILDATRSSKSDFILLDGKKITRSNMELTANFSWKIDSEFSKYFSSQTIGDYLICTSGMTIGDNQLFTREIQDEHILEPYEFQFFEDPITLEKERDRARLKRLSPQMESKIKQLESAGKTKRNLRVVPKTQPTKIKLPNNDYRPYNKAISGIVYKPPRFVVYWKDDGDAVLTFKKNGGWYLHGVGGGKFFGRSGLTWSLVSPKINMRYLEEGYILDSGAPCAFLRDGVNEDELWFIFAWTLSDLASLILKSVINHTRNIQSKDIERLPYPFWVSDNVKTKVISLMKSLVMQAREGREFLRSDNEMVELSKYFDF